jgi:hypothetical protein
MSVNETGGSVMRVQFYEYLGRCASICMFASILVVVAVDSASAITASGTAVYVVPAAAAAGTTGRRTLQVDGDVFMGDKVQTGPGGEAQIQFKDATKLVVGPNSSMTIDAFVFDERNTARKITMNAAKGAFRFITGNSEKQAYTINTPTATIGIRGTRFDFSVAGNGEMTFALFDGQARVCDRAGNCRDVRGNCEVVVTPPGGGVDPAAWSPSVAGRFPYVQSQDSLLPAFRVSTAGCGSRGGTMLRERSASNSDQDRGARRERSFDAPDRGPHCGGGYGEGSGQTERGNGFSNRSLSSAGRSFGGQSGGSQKSSNREGRSGRNSNSSRGSRGGDG